MSKADTTSLSFFFLGICAAWKKSLLYETCTSISVTWWQVYCRGIGKCFRGNSFAVHYTIRIALSMGDDEDRAKNPGNRRTRFLQLALTSWFYSFHELALHNLFASSSFFARNLRCADRFRVYVNLLEITSSKRRRTVIPLPQEESATGLKRAIFMRGFLVSLSWRFFSDFPPYWIATREKWIWFRPPKNRDISTIRNSIFRGIIKAP